MGSYRYPTKETHLAHLVIFHHHILSNLLQSCSSNQRHAAGLAFFASVPVHSSYETFMLFFLIYPFLLNLNDIAHYFITAQNSLEKLYNQQKLVHMYYTKPEHATFSVSRDSFLILFNLSPFLAQVSLRMSSPPL